MYMIIYIITVSIILSGYFEYSLFFLFYFSIFCWYSFVFLFYS